MAGQFYPTCAPKWWSCAPSFSLNNYILGPRIENHQPSPKFYLCTRMRKCTPTLVPLHQSIQRCRCLGSWCTSSFGSREIIESPHPTIGMCTNSLIHCPPSNGCKRSQRLLRPTLCPPSYSAQMIMVHLDSGFPNEAVHMGSGADLWSRPN